LLQNLFQSLQVAYPRRIIEQQVSSMKLQDYQFCPQCGSPLQGQGSETDRRRCVAEGCSFVAWGNPTPVVAVLCIQNDAVLLAHNVTFPPGVIAPIAGFVEAGEDPAHTAKREVMEELSLNTETLELLGVFPFAHQNQVIIGYAAKVSGEVVLNEELDSYKWVALSKLKAWDFGTGAVVAALLAQRAQGRLSHLFS
jgi:NADH pyrophosphatase NudC (nudix superfamily)